MTRRAGWLLAAAALILLTAASAPAFPRETEGSGSGTPAAQPQEPQPSQEGQEGQMVEKILREQEDLLKGERFVYDPAGRRDPFRSLLEIVKPSQGKRPPGIAGMLVTEIDLVGTIKDRSGGDLAFFMGSDNKGYFLKVGDEVYDGTLIAVDPRAGTVTFRQQVDDPRLIKPYRDVVKRLVPLEDMANE
jgi:hypothetical protein